jgi:hypothetical protein
MAVTSFGLGGKPGGGGRTRKAAGDRVLSKDIDCASVRQAVLANATTLGPAIPPSTTERR